MSKKLDITNHILVTKKDEETGEIFYVDSYEQQNESIRYKGGWRRTYMEFFDVFEICNSNLEIRILTKITKTIKRGFTVEINQSEYMEEFGCSRKTISNVISKFKKANFIRGEKRIYKTNPFMFIPYNSNANDIEEAQGAWKKESDETNN